ncbi:Hint domain-containing protein [Parasedimentitalea psychrophila]|uniref:Hint domain-containing protein n=1 Tax=Parasedimentitalea psychrophila TaxID=2997337 RepID=A0A9Y2P4H7_9RHOB|nr:Hint domain-containing protein [Parasedimentitalea psychrophila]WIY25334.1 Hint domain-containing protein [Parasedimentitalea psychrophila]
MFDWITKRKPAPVASGLGTELPLVSTGQGGLLAGTHVASNLGWRPVEALSVGDRVLTFDHGMQEITELHRETILMPEEILMDPQCPMFVPQDALHNRVPMWVMPDQGILVESDLAEDAQGDPFVVVPACALEGYRGIHRAAAGQCLQLVMPRFAQDQVIYLEAGLLAFSATPFSILESAAPRDGLYRVLQQDAARDLITDMIVDEAFWTADVPAGSAAQCEAQFVSVR